MTTVSEMLALTDGAQATVAKADEVLKLAKVLQERSIIHDQLVKRINSERFGSISLSVNSVQEGARTMTQSTFSISEDTAKEIMELMLKRQQESIMSLREKIISKSKEII